MPISRTLFTCRRYDTCDALCCRSFRTVCVCNCVLLQVDFFAHTYEQCMVNYKILQQSFNKLGIDKVLFGPPPMAE
jgi:hypothetical protein